MLLSAGSTINVGSTEMRLESSLHRTFHSDGRAFDLKGQVAVVAVNGSLPKGIDVYHMALRPGWKGWPGYYFLNFKQQEGQWYAIKDINDEYLTFTGASIMETDRMRIEFTWDNLGGLMTEKPKHFATYDVSVSFSDAQGKHYILTNPGVPTD